MRDWSGTCDCGARRGPFFLSFILYQRAVAEYGPGPAGMYGKLGILVPMVLSMVVWNELPTTVQWAGLIVALCAIVVSQTGGGRRFGSPGGVHPVAVPRPLLIVLLLSMGFAEFSNKLFERFGDDQVRSLFLALLFGTALIARNGRGVAAEQATFCRRDRLGRTCRSSESVFFLFFDRILENGPGGGRVSRVQRRQHRAHRGWGASNLPGPLDATAMVGDWPDRGGAGSDQPALTAAGLRCEGWNGPGSSRPPKAHAPLKHLFLLTHREVTKRAHIAVYR